MLAAMRGELPFRVRKRVLPSRHAAQTAATKRVKWNGEHTVMEPVGATPRQQEGDLADSLAVLRKSGAVAGAVNFEVKASASEVHSFQGQERPRWIGRSKPVVLPALQLRESSIPHGGLGVFTPVALKKGTWLTEYGGEVIDIEEARRRRDDGEDTHIRSCGYMDICIDSRVRSCWDLPYYVRHHMVGGFLNDAHGSELGTNAQYVTVDTTGYQHPYDGGRWVSKRVYLRATQDIPAGGELLASYGTTYHGLHFKA